MNVKSDDFVKRAKPVEGLVWPRESFSSPSLHAHKSTPPAERMRKPSRPRMRRSWQEGLKIGKWGNLVSASFDKDVLLQPRFSPRSLKWTHARQGARVQKKKKGLSKPGFSTRSHGFLSYHMANFSLSSWVSSQYYVKA